MARQKRHSAESIVNKHRKREARAAAKAARQEDRPAGAETGAQEAQELPMGDRGGEQAAP